MTTIFSLVIIQFLSYLILDKVANNFVNQYKPIPPQPPTDADFIRGYV